MTEGTRVAECQEEAAAAGALPTETLRSAPPFPWPAAAAVVAGRIAVDTGWSPVVPGMPGVPGTASAASASQSRSPALVQQYCISAVELWLAVVPQSSDIARYQICSETVDNEWTQSRVAVYTAAGVTAAFLDIPAEY